MDKVNAQVRQALERSIVLLEATAKFIESNPVREYTVFYNEAECDGYCLRDDCENALEDAKDAIAELDRRR